ncbi:MAG: thiamine phosphate synthase [Actinomycetota bacterium]
MTGCRLDLDDFLAQVLSSGVDMVQLRDKTANPDQISASAEVCRRRTSEAGALFIVNDHPEVARDSGADGVHLGQDDMPVIEARRIVGPQSLIGRSTHSQDQVREASAVEYVGVGPVFATPTKPGRPPVGVELVEFAAAFCDLPVFAIGGIDLRNLSRVIDAGARRVAVVRALTEAPDPASVASKMRRLLDQAQP